MTNVVVGLEARLHPQNSFGIPAWYALKVHTRSEEIAATALKNRGYEFFAPKYLERRRYSDRLKVVETAAFPGYIFCRFTELTRVPVLSSPAVAYIVSIAGVPVPISEAEIDAVRRAMEVGARPSAYLTAGQRVRIEYGPMAGVEGTLTRTDAESRVTLSVDVLQRSVAVIVEFDQVRAI